MPTKPSHPDWTADDAVNLRLFLQSETGTRALAWLKHWAPVLLDGSHVNKTLVASGEVKGYSSALEHLFSLVTDNPIPDSEKPVSDEYPNLDDDSKWTEEQNSRDKTK